MYTYEMIKLADENGKTYRAGNNDSYIRYNKSLGFHDCNGKAWGAVAYTYTKDGLNTFIHEEGWVELKKKLTKAQLVEIVGYDFEII